jgi:hypothetical protein
MKLQQFLLLGDLAIVTQVATGWGSIERVKANNTTTGMISRVGTNVAPLLNGAYENGQNRMLRAPLVARSGFSRLEIAANSCPSRFRPIVAAFFACSYQTQNIFTMHVRRHILICSPSFVALQILVVNRQNDD